MLDVIKQSMKFYTSRQTCLNHSDSSKLLEHNKYYNEDIDNLSPIKISRKRQISLR